MEPKRLSILIPVYNECKTVGIIIKKVKKVLSKLNCINEIIVVDDGSKDGTYKKLKLIKGIKLIMHKRNKGKGKAIRTGLNYASGDWVIIQDADLEYNPLDWIKLVETLRMIASKKSKTEEKIAIFGSRFLNKSRKQLKMPLLYYLGNKLITGLVNLLFTPKNFSKLTDVETCYKLMPSSALKEINLTSSSFAVEVEITCKLLKKGYNIIEVPIDYKRRVKGKKLIWFKDGILSILTLFRVLNS